MLVCWCVGVGVFIMYVLVLALLETGMRDTSYVCFMVV